MNRRDRIENGSCARARANLVLSAAVAAWLGGALSVARAEGNGSVAERSWLIVGEVVEIATGPTFMTEGGRPLRYSLVKIRLENRHKEKAGEEVTVFTRRSIWEKNGELRVTTSSTSPLLLVRPGEVVATRLIKGKDNGTGRPTEGS
jgi:hypothetical protein